MAFRKLVLQPECRKRENSDVGHESTEYTSCLERPPCTHDCGMKKLEQGVKAHYSFSFINKKKRQMPLEIPGKTKTQTMKSCPDTTKIIKRYDFKQQIMCKKESFWTRYQNYFPLPSPGDLLEMKHNLSTLLGSAVSDIYSFTK